MHTCKNCGHQFEGNYCNQCGQPAATHKINWHFIWHDVQHGLLHFDSGLIYTLKELYTRPGHTIREFIDGKRVQHFKPLSLLIVLATFYGFLSHILHINLSNDTPTPEDSIELVKQISKVYDWINAHYAFYALLVIPFYAVASFLSFRKQGYNYIEHLVLNTFLMAQILVFRIAMIPLLYYYRDVAGPTETISNVSNVVEFLIIFYGYSQLFHNLSKVQVFLRTILTYIILFISVIIAVLTGIVIITLILYFTGALYKMTD